MASHARPIRFPLALTLLFATCIAIAGVAAVALVIATVELVRSTRDVEHTLHVQKALETLQLTLVDAETGQRGFLLTGDIDFLKPYIDAVARQAYYVGTLERLVAQDPEQQKALQGLKTLLQERLRMLSETMTLARNAGIDAARANLNRGRDLMAQARLALQGMREYEDRRLTARQMEVERRSRYGAMFMLLSNGASLLGLTVLYVAMRGYHRRRRELERDVRESEHEFREVFDKAEAAQAACELNSARFVRANRRWSDITGYSPEELKRTTLIDLLPRANRLDNARAYRELVEGATEAIHLQQPVRRKDDSTFPACIRLTLARSESGEPLHGIAVVEDLSERIGTATTLEETRRLLMSIIDATADIVFAKDIEGRYQLANRAMQEVMGDPPGGLVGMSDADLIANAAQLEIIRAHDLAVLGSGNERTFEETLSLTGHARTFSITRAPWLDARGEIAGIVGRGHEITRASSARRPEPQSSVTRA